MSRNRRDSASHFLLTAVSSHRGLFPNWRRSRLRDSWRVLSLPGNKHAIEHPLDVLKIEMSHASPRERHGIDLAEHRRRWWSWSVS